MGRPRAYDSDEALERAKSLFMREGYGRATVQVLLERLDLSRSSLYGAFTDKDTLFLQALDRYVAADLAGALALLDGPGPALGRVRAFLGALVDAAAGDPGRGCLLVTSVLERVPHDEAVTARTRAAFALMGQRFARVLAEAAAAGDLRPGLDVGAAAQLLVTVVNGLQVMLRAEADPARLHRSVDAAVLALSAAPFQPPESNDEAAALPSRS